MDFSSLVPTEKVKDTLPEKVKDPKYNDSVSPWLWNEEVFDSAKENTVSFVYRITNKLNGKFYIGYKGFLSKKTKVVKGKKKHLLVESNWLNYWSSGDNLHKDIDKYGTGNFKREILAFCPNKATGKYFELVLQVKYGVLTFNSENTYNGIVNLRLGGATLKKYKEIILSDELKNIKI